MARVLGRRLTCGTTSGSGPARHQATSGHCWSWQPPSPASRWPGPGAVAGAKDDDSFTAEPAELLERALTDAGVDHTLEFYPARHGFAVPDNPTYNTHANARHWEALRELYRADLQGS